MIFGALLVLSGAGLFTYNQYEALQAAKAVDQLMPELLTTIEQVQEESSSPEIGQSFPEISAPVDSQPKTTAITIDGHDYIGYVSIPALSLELPVMEQWSYPKLKLSPCRYSGSAAGNDLVILAHNYDHHFGHIAELSSGDSVTFTDLTGSTTSYQVVALDILVPTAIEEMTCGEYDLTLFTCTYGGQNRVTIRCDRVDA